jgi:GxxExxY protein
MRLDLVVERLVVAEVKSVDRLLPIHRAQVLTYLKLTSYSLGLLINFNVELLRSGIRRLLNG